MWEPAQYKKCTEYPCAGENCADLSEPVASGEVFAFIQGNVDKSMAQFFYLCVCIYIYLCPSNFYM